MTNDAQNRHHAMINRRRMMEKKIIYIYSPAVQGLAMHLKKLVIGYWLQKGDRKIAWIH